MAQAAAIKSPKDRILLQIKSLDPQDDERKTISKIVSWILRRGAAAVGVSQDPQRWVRFSDICACEVLRDYSQDLIWAVIVEFNAKKVRYEISGEEMGAQWTYLRAHKKDDQTAVDPVLASADGQQLQQPQDSQQLQAQQAAYSSAAAQQMNPWNYYGWNQMMMMPFMNPYMWQQAAMAQGKFQGRIKSINADKGFGFIECQQTYAQHNRDVFLHKAQIGDLQEGSYVQFSCEVNKQGMPQARDVRPLGGPMTPMQSAFPFMDGKSGGKGKDGSKGKASGKGRGKDGKKGKGEGGGKGEKGDSKNGKGKKGGPTKEGARKDTAGEGAATASPQTDSEAVSGEAAAPKDAPCEG